MKSSDADRALEPLAVRRGAQRVARDRDERRAPAPRPASRSPRRAPSPGARRRPRRARRRGSASGRSAPVRSGSDREVQRRRGSREHRAARAVEVAGQDAEQVERPAGERAEALHAGAHAPVGDGAARFGELAREPADRRRRDAAARRDALRREARPRSRSTASSPFTSPSQRAEPRRGPRRTARGSARAGRRRRRPADEVVLVARARRLAAARIDHDELAAARAQRGAAACGCPAPSSGCPARPAGSRRASGSSRCGRRPAPDRAAGRRTCSRPARSAARCRARRRRRRCACRARAGARWSPSVAAKSWMRGIAAVDRDRVGAARLAHAREPLGRARVRLVPADLAEAGRRAQQRTPQAVGVLLELAHADRLRADLALREADRARRRRRAGSCGPRPRRRGRRWPRRSCTSQTRFAASCPQDRRPVDL